MSSKYRHSDEKTYDKKCQDFLAGKCDSYGHYGNAPTNDSVNNNTDDDDCGNGISVNNKINKKQKQKSKKKKLTVTKEEYKKTDDLCNTCKKRLHIKFIQKIHILNNSNYH